jgi:HSP20 family protein
MMLYRTSFPANLFAEFDRLQRDMQGLFDSSPSIRGLGRGGYPALNVGSTPTSVEVYAFAPGMDAASIDVTLDRGVLSLSGERTGQAPASDAKSTTHLDERFTGRFRRVVSLPDDIDPNAIQADYRDGVLRVSIQRRASAQPRRITVQ